MKVQSISKDALLKMVVGFADPQDRQKVLRIVFGHGAKVCFYGFRLHSYRKGFKRVGVTEGPFVARNGCPTLVVREAGRCRFGQVDFPDARKASVKTTKALLGMLTVALGLAVEVQAQFNYATNGGTITITGYTGSDGAVTIPETIRGLPVTGIGESAFYHRTNLTSVTIPKSVTSIGSCAFYFCTSLTNVTIPNSVTSIGSSAFYFCTGLASVTIPSSVTRIGRHAFKLCTSLTSVTVPDSVANVGHDVFYFCDSLTNVTIANSVTSLASSASNSGTIPRGIYRTGNAPGPGQNVLSNSNNTTIYLPGITGWSTAFAGRPTALWNPQVQTSISSFGVRSNQFGFTLVGSSNLVVVVEACTDLTNPIWSPVSTNTLTEGSSHFSDPQWTNYPARFCRVRSP